MTQQNRMVNSSLNYNDDFPFGMISFVTNLAALWECTKNQFSVSNALGMLGNLATSLHMQ